MELLVYLIKVNAGILFLYSFYRLFLGNDTFFRWKRIFLLSVLFIAFLFPLVEILMTGLSSKTAPEATGLPVMYLDDIIITSSGATASGSFSIVEHLPQIVSVLYFTVALGLIIRILAQLISILPVVRKTTKTTVYNTSICVKEGLQTPFSFFDRIVLDPEKYKEKELKEILLHEQTHVRQGHSFDMILSELVCACCWFNPFVWLLKKEIRVNLEYLADQAVLQSGCEAEQYQFHLLQLSYSKAIAQITNNFNVSPLKKRIFMMNKKQTSRQSMWKYTLLVPVIAFLAWINFSLKAESPIFMPVQEAMNETALILEAPTVAENAPVDQLQDKKDSLSVKEKVYSHAQVEPSFPGGKEALNKWIGQNIIYPKEAIDAGIQGQVIVRFVVDETGKVSNPEIVRFVIEDINTQTKGSVVIAYPPKKEKTAETETHKATAELLNIEVLRLVNAMPDWTPGTENGKAITTYINYPFSFRLE